MTAENTSCSKTIMIMAESPNSKRIRRAEIRARFKADIERTRQQLSKDLGIPISVLRDICENATEAFGDHVEDDEIILRPWNTRENEEDRLTSMTPPFATSSNSSTISSSSTFSSNQNQNSLAGPSNVTPQLSISLPHDLQRTPPRGSVRPRDTESLSQRRSKRIRLRGLHLRETTPALRPMVVVDIESPSPERGDSMTIASNPTPRIPSPLRLEREPTTPGERDYIFVNSSPVLESTKFDGGGDEGSSPLRNKIETTTQLPDEKDYLFVNSSPVLKSNKIEDDDEVTVLPSSPNFLPVLPPAVGPPRLLQFRSASAPPGECPMTKLPDRPIDKTVEHFLRKFKCEHLANWFAFLKLHAAPNLEEAARLVNEDDERFMKMFRKAAVQCAISDQEAEMVLQALRECRGIEWYIE